MRDLNKYSPVFLLAPARSHSSVVASMIGCHPQLYGFPELVLFSTENVGERLVAPPAIGKQPLGWNPVVGLERAIAELEYGSQDEYAIKLAHRWLEERKDWTGAQVMDHLLGLISPCRGVEKSPETVHSIDNMMRIADAYPRAQFIHLVRHPVTSQRSVQRYYFLYDHPVHCARGWINQHKRILDFRHSIDQDRSVMIRSEDVLNKPYVSLKYIADWLGISNDDDAIKMMMNTSSSPYVYTHSSTASVWHDPTFLKDPEPHSVELPSSLDRPNGWDIPEDIWSEVATLAKKLGYGDNGE